MDFADVVVELGRTFETARISSVDEREACLVGRWPETVRQETLTVLVGEDEVQTRVVDSRPGRLRLRPLLGECWSPDAQALWSRARPQAAR